MKDNFENTPSNSLFHFTSLKTAAEYILPNMQLRLGLLENTNDPRETKSLGFGAVNGEFKQGEEISDHMNWNDHITKLLRKNCKVICFSTDYVIDGELYDGHNLPRMWAQYGENHKGVCLEIDRELFKEENSILLEDSYLEPINYGADFEYPWVHYNRIRAIGLEAYVDEFRVNNRKYLFYSKLKDWESERETRLLKFSKVSSDEYTSIRKSIKRIILGIDFNNIYLPTIIKLANEIVIEKIQSENGHLKSFRFKEEYLQNMMKIDSTD